jgi:hypothetical protein
MITACKQRRKTMNSKFGLSGIFTLFVLAVLSACGGGSSTGTETAASTAAVLIESNDAGSAYSAKIAIDSNGNALAVWAQFDGSRSNIWSNRYTATSNSWGTAALIETDNTSNALNPQIAFDANGDALAVWDQGDGIRQNIWSNRYTAASNAWGTAVLIETDSGGAISPQLAIDANGNALAVWSGGLNIWSNRYTAATNSWGTAALIEINAGSAGRPHISIDANGNALAVWAQDGDTTSATRDDIWSNRYTIGSGWGPPVLIETNMGGADNPRIAMNASGNAIAVWQQSDGTRDNIWANRYIAGTGAGSGWGTAARIETDNVGSAVSPQLAIDSNGNALAVWQQDGDASAVVNDDIWFNRYTAGTSNSWGTAALMETGVYRAASPQIAMNASGNAIAVWYQLDGTRQNILSRRYSAGSGWDTVAYAETYNGDSLFPQITINDNNHAMAVWEQVAAGGVRHDIWAVSY